MQKKDKKLAKNAKIWVKIKNQKFQPNNCLRSIFKAFWRTSEVEVCNYLLRSIFLNKKDGQHPWFKKKAEESYVVVATGEPAPHGSIILEAGVLTMGAGGGDYTGQPRPLRFG